MKTRTQQLFLIMLMIMMVGLSACAPQPAQPTAAPAQTEDPAPAKPEAPAPSGAEEIILATTTSTQDSGLLDVLVPAFEKMSGFTVKTVAVGTGQALKMGEQCNADVLLVHAPASEKTYMEGGFGAERKLVMHNDFVIVGPKDDPAGIKGMKTTVEAFTKIAEAKAVFVSRGDDSGTHKSELAFWKKANLDPKGSKAEWYLESGQSMGVTLKIASEKKGYTLTDRATYLANLQSLDLAVLVEGDNALLNVYHVITVNPAKCPKVVVDGAKAFADYVVSAEGQELIGKFGADKFGQPLFTPDADKTDADLGLK